MRRRPDDGLGPTQVAALHAALARHVRAQYARQGKIVQRRQKVLDGGFAAAGPASAQHHPVTHVGRDHDLAGECRCRAGEPRGILDGPGPHDDPVGAVRERPLHAPAVAHPAPELGDCVRAGHQLAHQGAVVAPAQRGVQIHHVQGAEALAPPARGDRCRVGEGDLLGLGKSAHPLDAATAAEIDGGEGDHGGVPAAVSSRSFRRADPRVTGPPPSGSWR